MPPPPRPLSARGQRNGDGVGRGLEADLTKQWHRIPTRLAGGTEEAGGAQSMPKLPSSSVARPTGAAAAVAMTRRRSRVDDSSAASAGAAAAEVAMGPRRTWRASTPIEKDVAGAGEKVVQSRTSHSVEGVAGSSTVAPEAAEVAEAAEAAAVVGAAAAAALMAPLRASITDLRRQLAVELGRRDSAERSRANTLAAATEAAAQEAREARGGPGRREVGVDGEASGGKEDGALQGPDRSGSGNNDGGGEREGGRGSVMQDARARAARASGAAARLEAEVAAERQRLRRLDKEVKVRLKKLREEGERGDKAAEGITAARAALNKAKSQASVGERKARDSAPAVARELETERVAADRVGRGTASSSGAGRGVGGGVRGGGAPSTNGANASASTSTSTAAAWSKSEARVELDAAEDAMITMRSDLGLTRRELERARQEHRELEQTAARLEEAGAQARAERAGLVSPVDGVSVDGGGGGLSARGGADAAVAAGLAGAAAEAAREATDARVEAAAARTAAAAATARCSGLRRDAEKEVRGAAEDLVGAVSAVAAAESEGRRRVASFAARALLQHTRVVEAVHRLTGATSVGGEPTTSGKTAHRGGGRGGGGGNDKKPSEAERDNATAAARKLAALISDAIEAEADAAPIVQLAPAPLGHYPQTPWMKYTNNNVDVSSNHQHQDQQRESSCTSAADNASGAGLGLALPVVCQLCRSDPYVDTSVASQSLARSFVGTGSRGGGDPGGSDEGGGGVGGEGESLFGIINNDAAVSSAAAAEDEAAAALAALEVSMKEMRVHHERLSASTNKARSRRDTDASYAKQLSRDLIDSREAAARARTSASTHTRRFASSEDYDRESTRAETATASLAKTKEETRRHKERAAVNKEAVASLDGSIHVKLVEHVRRERAACAVKDEMAAVTRQLAAARRLLRDYSGGGGGDPGSGGGVGGGGLYERMGGGGGDPQWRRVRELEEELTELRAKSEEGKRELRRAERDVQLAESLATNRLHETDVRDAAALRAATQAVARARVEAEGARREGEESAAAGAAAASHRDEIAAELAQLEGEARAVGADLRYLASWRDTQAPARNLGTSPVVVVDIQPGVQ